MVEQLIIEKIKISYGSDSFIDLNVTVQQLSEREMSIEGSFVFKQTINDRISNELIISHLNNGNWIRTFVHRFDSFCRQVIMPGGTFFELKKKYFKDLPDKCPLAKGLHEIKKAIFSKYREDWDAGLKSVIPPFMPDAEKNRLEIIFYNEKNKKIGAIQGEGKFLDKNSRSGVCECK